MRECSDFLDDRVWWEGFWAAPARALLLDYDGTLAPFVEDRDRAFPYPGVAERIRDILRAKQVRVVIVSGRSVDVVQRLLGVEDALEIWGSHGGQRLHADGRQKALELPAQEREVVDAALDWAREHVPSSHVEQKPFSAAVHWRGLDEPTARRVRTEACQRFDTLAESVGQAMLEAHRFDGGVELRSKRFNKGRAIQTLRSELGSGAVFVYLGDDMTDEDAFVQLNQTATPVGDVGVLVRATPRPTAATVQAIPPAELLALLDRVALHGRVETRI